jgi:hypothetical protein
MHDTAPIYTPFAVRPVSTPWIRTLYATTILQSHRLANPTAIMQLVFRLAPLRRFNVPRAKTYMCMSVSAHSSMTSSTYRAKLDSGYYPVLFSRLVIFQRTCSCPHSRRCCYLDRGLTDPHCISSCRVLRLQRIHSTQSADLYYRAIISETRLVPYQVPSRSWGSPSSAHSHLTIAAGRRDVDGRTSV